MSRKTNIAARFALLLATIIWGATFFILKNTIDEIPFVFVLAIRFTIGFLLLCVLFANRLKNLNKAYFKEGILIGLFIFLAYYIQTIGLKFTTPGKNAFLTAVYCVIVPFLFWAVNKKKPDKYNIIAAFCAIAGIGFVSLDGDFTVGIGDLFTLIGGFFYAAHIVAVAKFSDNRDPVLITIVQFLYAAVYCWIISFMTVEISFDFSKEVVLSIGYLGIFGTGVALLLQNVGQKYTNPSAASIILSLEAVFGVIFSVVFANEGLELKEIIGFVLIFSAIVISETKLDFLNKKSRNNVS